MSFYPGGITWVLRNAISDSRAANELSKASARREDINATDGDCIRLVNSYGNSLRISSRYLTVDQRVSNSRTCIGQLIDNRREEPNLKDAALAKSSAEHLTPKRAFKVWNFAQRMSGEKFPLMKRKTDHPTKCAVSSEIRYTRFIFGFGTSKPAVDGGSVQNEEKAWRRGLKLLATSSTVGSGWSEPQNQYSTMVEVPRTPGTHGPTTRFWMTSFIWRLIPGVSRICTMLD
ncbi:hypothetical protein F5146DRAFT_1180746 [Armillaria mellea]|nr:hypothetical protein F5146DRAFT_1180746 [Armillaria mellea]